MADFCHFFLLTGGVDASMPPWCRHCPSPQSLSHMGKDLCFLRSNILLSLTTWDLGEGVKLSSPRNAILPHMGKESFYLPQNAKHEYLSPHGEGVNLASPKMQSFPSPSTCICREGFFPSNAKNLEVLQIFIFYFSFYFHLSIYFNFFFLTFF